LQEAEISPSYDVAMVARYWDGRLPFVPPLTFALLMKTVTTILMSAAVAAFASGGFAAEEKETKDKTVTLEGTATCAKCDLGTEDQCATVLQVKEGDKTVTYYITGEPDKAFHKKICKSSKEAKATGTVTEKDGKKMLEVTSIEEKTKK
jgi:hypothetical protein